MELSVLKKEFDLTDEMLNKLDTYARFLIEYNEKINLTAITKYEDIIEKHFYDSMLLTKNMKIEGSFVDVGTGAGFPGVVIKICEPELDVYLIEPLKKRCVFLNELIQLLNLKNIHVINERAENYSLKNREKYDFVTARAVTNLPNLIEVCGAMVKKDGYFIALRGLNGKNELIDAKNAIKEMSFIEENTYEFKLSDASTRIISYLRKISKTNKKYPRKYTIIKAKPL